MSSNDNLDSEGQPLDQAQPYRTPAEVSEPTKAGVLASPIAWIGAIGLVVALAGRFLLAPVSTDSRNTIDYVEDFGITRSGPIEEPPEFDDIEIAEEQAAPASDN